MSENPAPRRVLFLRVDGHSADELAAFAASSTSPGDIAEIFSLTEANACEALAKIFAADTVAVWSKTG
jgi:hypothetical protein